MNLLCDASNFQKNNIIFLEMKKNVVIDGYFTKMIYSDSTISLNGLYIHCSIIPDEMIDEHYNEHHNEDDNDKSRVVKQLDGPTIMSHDNSYDSYNETKITSSRSSILPYDHWTEKCKKIVYFSLTNPMNIQFMKDMNRIEHEIIEYYKDFFKINKINVYSLRNQIKTGSIKVICRTDTEDVLNSKNETDSISQHSSSLDLSTTNIKKSVILKISGIWETDTNIGITYKFQK